MTEPASALENGTPPKVRLPFPGFWQGLALGLAPVLLGCLLGIPILLVKLTGLMKNPDALMPLVQTLCFLPVLAAGCRLAKRPWREVFPLAAPRWSLLPAFLLAQAGITVLTIGVDAVWGRILPEPKAIQEMLKAAGPVVVVFIAPITEEPLCRGLILGGLLLRYPKGKAVLLSALIFALMHANPWQFFPPLMIGLLYGWVVAETRSLWFPILGHLLHNGLFALGMTLAIPWISGESHPLPPWLWLAGLAATLAGGALLRRAFAPKAI